MVYDWIVLGSDGCWKISQIPTVQAREPSNRRSSEHQSLSLLEVKNKWVPQPSLSSAFALSGDSDELEDAHPYF